MTMRCLLLLLACGCAGKSKPVAVVEEPPLAEIDQLFRDAPGDARPGFKFKDCNLVFVSFDALQAKHVGHLGNPRKVTPTIDAVARHGFTFTAATSVASWTVPSSMTWFTGVHPSEHRMTNKFAVYAPPVQKTAKLKELSPGLMTLADILKQNGYATAGFTGNAGVSGGFGYEQGFDVYDHPEGKFGGMDRSVPKALEWLAKNHERKFFLFLHGYDVHGQNMPAKGYDFRFVDPAYDKRFTGSPQEQEALREEGLERGGAAVRDADALFWRAVYDEKVERVDARFNRFLEAFARRGLLRNTVFVLTSDHGTELHEHRRFDHGFTLYQEQIHVPLVIRLPGRMEGGKITDRVSSIDLMPTILDLLDVEVPARGAKQMRGTSLVSALSGEPARRDVFSETDYRRYTYKRSIIAPDGWKLVYTMEARSRELFNLNDDPGEQRNLGAIEPHRADELERRLFAHFKAIGHDLTDRAWEIGMNPVYPSQGKDKPK